jgi:hypothetical protein
MLAATIRIDAGFEAYIRAVIVGNDGACAVAQKLSARQRIFFRVPVGIRFELNLLEAIRGIARRAAVCGGEDGGGSFQYSVFSIQNLILILIGRWSVVRSSWPVARRKLSDSFVRGLSFGGAETANGNCMIGCWKAPSGCDVP